MSEAAEQSTHASKGKGTEIAKSHGRAHRLWGKLRQPLKKCSLLEEAEEPTTSSKGKGIELPTPLDEAQTLWKSVRQQLKKLSQLEDKLRVYTEKEKSNTYHANKEHYPTITTLDCLSKHSGTRTQDMLQLDRDTNDRLAKDDVYSAMKREQTERQTTLQGSWSALTDWRAFPPLESISREERLLLSEIASVRFKGLLDHAEMLIARREKDDPDYEGDLECLDRLFVDDLDHKYPDDELKIIRNLCYALIEPGDEADLCLSLILKFIEPVVLEHPPRGERISIPSGKVIELWTKKGTSSRNRQPLPDTTPSDETEKLRLEKEYTQFKNEVDVWLAEGRRRMGQ